MKRALQRRTLLRGAGAAAAALAVPRWTRAQASQPAPVRLGIIGTGGRGTGLLRSALDIAGVRIPAVCDVDAAAAEQAADIVRQAGQPRADAYVQGDEAYRGLLQRHDIDAVIIATPWHWHARMAVDAMRAGKAVGVEVPAALTLDECWDLVNTCEQTRVPCMMLENWSFRRDNLAVLNMIRAGLFGRIVHSHCAHSHDCIDHWFWDARGNERWPARYLVEYNRDQYPTHSLGPVLSWMDIPCGDYFATVASTATGSFGINDYFDRKFGPDHPNARRTFAQGDIVTSIVRTHAGKTIVINYDMQLPRPYDNRWLIQGTRGLYNEQRAAVYAVERSPHYHQWEPFESYQEQFEHDWWKRWGGESCRAGHDGTDGIMLRRFVASIRDKSPLPLDIYESVLMSVIVPLSEQSIQSGGVPVPCPDFTRGAWKSRKPAFAMS